MDTSDSTNRQESERKVATITRRYLALGCAVGLVLSSCTAAAPKAGTAEPAPARELIAITAPDAGWHLRIERIVEFDSEVWVLARLWREPGPAAQVIQPATAMLPVDLPAKPRRVFVAGKTWSWENKEPVEFVPSLDPLLQRAGAGRVLYAAPTR